MMIDIDHVSFQYSGAERENLQNFNLQIEKGECVVLTGESGCGKTCVTRLINTLIPHFYEGEMSGTVLIDGVDTRTIQPHDLSDKIGSVFQNPRSQFFSLDTDSEIVFGMENKGMPYQVMLDRYQQTIQELHIEKLKDRNLFDLSGGQKQTIAFASVYALNPNIFVLDEPSSNLDPEAIQELRRLLLLIKAQGKTIIVSEHRLYFLNGIADRIVLMEHGKLKQSWSASDFALLSTEQIKALGLRSYTPTRLELPETTPSRNDTPAVEVKDLAIGYEKGEPVAQHLNFCVYPGEIVGVVGKNGCGKSTLARTLCGLQKELHGEVLYKNSTVPSKRRIKKAYLVMQDPDYQLFTDSVYQELLLALSDQKDKDEKRIDDILDELNLTIYKERHPMSLSGGQKQRTAIGVAALRDAEVLIFDEPTSGLDYKNMESVAGILSALSKRGKAILVISHDNELLMKICSRVIRVMSEQAKPVGASDKMKAKDFITLGIFTVLFFAVVMVCIFASAATVVTFAFGSAIAAIPGGIIYMLMRAKVPKAGSVLLSGVVIGLIEFLIGAGWAVAVGFIAGAVIAELLARAGHYKSFWLNTIGYSVYMTFFALGTYLPMVIMTGYVDDMSTSNGVSAEYLTELHSFMNGTMVVIIAVVTFVAGIVGALIAKGVFKKHFQKAGIV